MKMNVRNILLAISTMLLFACGKDNGKNESDNNFILNREDIIGCWQVILAKYDEGAKMTDWGFEDTYATFEENGLFKGEGYFGNGEGTYSVSGNVITTKVDNTPYIVYEITGFNEDKSQANLTATIQSNQMKIWMVVEKVEYLDIKPGDNYPGEQFFNQESDVKLFVIAMHNGLSKFAEKKLDIEQQLAYGNFSSLNASNEDIKSMWTSLYSTLNKINVALNSLNAKGSYEGHILHLKALRAFIAYNLSTLWGDVPFTITYSPNNGIKIMKSEDILKLASEDIGESYGYSSVYGYGYSLGLSNWYSYLNPNAAQVLHGEINLAQGKFDEAKGHFNLGNTIKVGKEEYHSWDMVFSFMKANTEDGNTEVGVLVYNKSILELLLQEANGKNDNLASDWKDISYYGYWQMLKRIGKAEELTGGQKYQLLFPYPLEEAAYWGHQNEGY